MFLLVFLALSFVVVDNRSFSNFELGQTRALRGHSFVMATEDLDEKSTGTFQNRCARTYNATKNRYFLLSQMNVNIPNTLAHIYFSTRNKHVFALGVTHPRLQIVGIHMATKRSNGWKKNSNLCISTISKITPPPKMSFFRPVVSTNIKIKFQVETSRHLNMLSTKNLMIQNHLYLFIFQSTKIVYENLKNSSN